MSGSAVVCPLGHTGDGYRIRRDGTAATAHGAKQLFVCVAADGTSHRFRGPLVTAPDSRRPGPLVRCPKPGHRDAKVLSRGVRATPTGLWRRYTCVRPYGERHNAIAASVH